MKRPKYGNKKCTANGVSYDSMLERDRHFILKDYERQGIISGVVHQKSIDLIVNGVKVCSLEPDYQYTMNGEHIVEDCKSPASITSTFQLKRKLLKAIHGLDIFIVQKASLHALPKE